MAPPGKGKGPGAGRTVARVRTVRYVRAVPPAFHHLAVQCADLAACERFYRDVLGLEVLRRWPDAAGGDRSVWLRVGEGFLALERAAEAPAASPWRDGRAGLHLVALRIGPGERGAWEERLARHGVAVVHRTRWTIYCRDPEGNRIGLSHHPHDPSDAVTGTGSAGGAPALERT